MRQLWLTIRNCIKLRTFRHFNVLYDHVDIPVIRVKHKIHGAIMWQIIPFKFVRIEIGKFKTKERLDTTLLHEIGHLIDINKKNNYSNYRECHNTKSREKNAWKECIRLADKYNTNICYESAINWLSSYGTKYKVLENRLGK